MESFKSLKKKFNARLVNAFARLRECGAMRRDIKQIILGSWFVGNGTELESTFVY